MVEERDIAELFLVNFIHELAQITQPSIQSEENTQNRATQISIPTVSISLPMPQKIVQAPPKPTVEINAFPPRILPRRVQTRPMVVPQQRPTYTAPVPRTDINQQQTTEKLSFLVKDPAVTEIECTGADQPLLVKKGGTIQRTRARLSIEEIYELIADFSQKTRIPILDGTLKAAVNNLIITAVLSEILGPRFIIQKKNPFQHLVQ